MVEPAVAAAVIGGPMFLPDGVFSATVRVVLTDWSSKDRVAIGSVENLPVPRMLWMATFGSVAALLSENSVPSSVPASHG